MSFSSWLKDLRDEYFGGSPKEIADHLLFKNEPVTIFLECLEIQKQKDVSAGRTSSSIVSTGGAISHAMDVDPINDAKLAIGGGALIMSGGKSLPLLLSGAQGILSDAATIDRQNAIDIYNRQVILAAPKESGAWPSSSGHPLWDRFFYALAATIEELTDAIGLDEGSK